MMSSRCCLVPVTCLSYLRRLLTIERVGAAATQVESEKTVADWAHHGERFQRSYKEARQGRPHKARTGQQCCDASHILSTCPGQGKLPTCRVIEMLQLFHFPYGHTTHVANTWQECLCCYIIPQGCSVRTSDSLPFQRMSRR